VAPGTVKISAELPGYTFSPDIQVHENAVTSDALVGKSDSPAPPGDGENTGGGGGGGCFIRTLE